MRKKQVFFLAAALLICLAGLALFISRPAVIRADLGAEQSLAQEELAQLSQELRAAGQVSDTTYANMPNTVWWADRWMEYATVSYAGIKGGTAQLHPDAYFVAGVDSAAKQIHVICSGYSGDVKVVLNRFQSTALGELSKVKVVVESVRSGGQLSGVVSPVIRETYLETTPKDNFTLSLKDLEQRDIYHIVISASGTEQVPGEVNANLPIRYEAEKAKCSGGASVTQAAAIGSDAVIFSEQAGELTFSVNAPEAGSYSFNFSYANTPGAGEPGYIRHDLLVDGVPAAKLSYPPTDGFAFASTGVSLDLEQGTHRITLKSDMNAAAASTVLIDCVDVLMESAQQEAAAVTYYQGLPIRDKTNETASSFYLVVPANGYYNIAFSTGAAAEETSVCSVNGTPSGVVKLDGTGEVHTKMFLQRGVNMIALSHKSQTLIKGVWVEQTGEQPLPAPEGAVLPLSIEGASAQMQGNVRLETAKNPSSTVCAAGFLTEKDQLTLSVNAPSEGTYWLTFSYAAYGAAHTIEKIPACITLHVNDNTQQLSCGDTLSPDTFRTVTVAVTLRAGQNTLAFSGVETDGAANRSVRIASAAIYQKCIDAE